MQCKLQARTITDPICHYYTTVDLSYIWVLHNCKWCAKWRCILGRQWFTQLRLHLTHVVLKVYTGYLVLWFNGNLVVVLICILPIRCFSIFCHVLTAKAIHFWYYAWFVKVCIPYFSWIFILVNVTISMLLLRKIGITLKNGQVFIFRLRSMRSTIRALIIITSK